MTILKAQEAVAVLFDTLEKQPAPPGFASFSWRTASAASALRKIITEKATAYAKIQNDPLLPERGRLHLGSQVEADALAALTAWREETLPELDAKLSRAIPSPPVPPMSPAYVAELVAGFDAIDPTFRSLFYLDPTTPPEVARAIEQAPARIAGGLGVAPRVERRITDEQKRARHYADAPAECRDAFDGLSQIRASLVGAASLAERKIRDE